MNHTEHVLRLDEEIKELPHVTKIIESGCSCWICGYDEFPHIMEKHHIAGKYNHPVVVYVCPNCHRILSKRQALWCVGWNNKSNDPEKKFGYLLLGISNILSLISTVLKTASNSLLR